MVTMWANEVFTVTKQDLEEMISYVPAHPEIIKPIAEYLSRSDIDKKTLEVLLIRKLNQMLGFMDLYYKSVNKNLIYLLCERKHAFRMSLTF